MANVWPWLRIGILHLRLCQHAFVHICVFMWCPASYSSSRGGVSNDSLLASFLHHPIIECHHFGKPSAEVNSWFIQRFIQASTSTHSSLLGQWRHWIRHWRWAETWNVRLKEQAKERFCRKILDVHDEFVLAQQYQRNQWFCIMSEVVS